MSKSRNTITIRIAVWTALLTLIALTPAWAQSPAPELARQQPVAPSPATAPHRTRLILTDGSYQLVLSYEVKGNLVRYRSAERDATEELPSDLIDWNATRQWEHQHSATNASDTAKDAAASQHPAPAIDPELLREEADRAAWTPLVAPDLHLPEQSSVLALDRFHDAPELVPLVQSDGELNRVTGHNVLKLAVNPRSASHQIEQLRGVESMVQLHVDTPALYLRLGDDTGVFLGGTPLTVDTHGASNSTKPDTSGGSPDSGYVLVRADVRSDARVLASFNIGLLGGPVKQQQNVIETASELLPGGHWIKLTPRHPLDPGEYALVEIISDHEINLGVWDFGIHPAAPENRDAIKPQPKRPLTLERRVPQ